MSAYSSPAPTVKWEFKTKGKQEILSYSLMSNPTDVLQENVGVREKRLLYKNLEATAALMEFYVPLKFTGLGVSIAHFYNLNKLLPEHFIQVKTIESPLLALAALYVFTAHPQATLNEVVRLAQITTNDNEAQEQPNILSARGILYRVSVQKTSLTEWLDTLDYFINGELKETYQSFHKIHAGRVFTLSSESTYVSRNVRYPQYFHHRCPSRDRDKASVDYKITSHTLTQDIHRFIQLAHRSQKLKKKLYNMPLYQLLNALAFGLPGTLLVLDTFDLLDSLKQVKLNYNTENNYRSYFTDDKSKIESNTGNMAQKIEEEGKTSELSKYFAFDGDYFIISDLNYYSSQALFIVHAIKILGPSKATETLAAIIKHKEVISMRSFMELVRRGGFHLGELPPFIIPLLSTK